MKVEEVPLTRSQEYLRTRACVTVLALALTATLPQAAWAATTDDGRWHPGIGDPTVIGWVTVLVYIAAFALCLRTTVLARRLAQPFHFWMMVTVVLALLGINKQLDLQTWFTEVGRDMALAQGWYEDRQEAQILFIGSMALAAVLLMFLTRHMLREAWHLYRTTCIGLGLLAFFVVARAASFHHIDQLLSLRWGQVSGNGVLENGALAVVMWGCWRASRTQSVRLPSDALQTGYSVLACPQCRQKLRVPSGRLLDISCARCGFAFRRRTL